MSRQKCKSMWKRSEKESDIRVEIQLGPTLLVQLYACSAILTIKMILSAAAMSAKWTP